MHCRLPAQGVCRCVPQQDTPQGDCAIVMPSKPAAEQLCGACTPSPLPGCSGLAGLCAPGEAHEHHVQLLFIVALPV